MHETIFLVPMSDNLSERVKSVLGKQEICHRENEFSEILTNVRNKLKRIINAGDDYTSIMFTGSGSAALPLEISRKWEEVTGVKPGQGFGLLKPHP